MNYLTDDGYIADQLKTAEMPYGRYRSDWNGCGWIAGYNILKYLNKAPDPEKVCADMSGKVPYGGKRGTPLRQVRSYLKANGVETRLTYWRAPSIEACRNCRCAIIRFFDEDYPHYVAILHHSGDIYRFLNDDGGDNHLAALDTFFASKVKRRFARVLTVDNEPERVDRA